jgi:tetratricopeptide (TPR) repeat protein
MVHRLYLENLSAAEKSPVRAEVQSLCERGQLEAAESRLKQILAGQSKNWPAMLLVMRAYAEDLRQPEKAIALLEPSDKKPRLHSAFVKYARESIDAWSAAPKVEREDSANPSSTPIVAEVSLDELLKNNQLATAVEFLEKAIADEPRNFELWLKLAEVHGVYCADLNQAGKIIQKMEHTSAFTAPEIQTAKNKLREWQKARWA